MASAARLAAPNQLLGTLTPPTAAGASIHLSPPRRFPKIASTRPRAHYRRGFNVKASIVFAVAVLGALAQPRPLVSAAGPTGKAYELRIYTAAPGKLDAVVTRFRDHTCKLFEKHGMTNVGYWTAEKDDGKLYYMLAHASRSAANESWRAFMADPEWKAVAKQTEANGRIVSKVERRYLTATDYSPAIKPPAGGGHVYELRTYSATPGNLDALNARFRDHTMKLFQKHGITNVGYWTPMKGEKGAGDTLVYLIAHKSMDAAKKSWAAFRQDPAWTMARKGIRGKSRRPADGGGRREVGLPEADRFFADEVNDPRRVGRGPTQRGPPFYLRHLLPNRRASCAAPFDPPDRT